MCALRVAFRAEEKGYGRNWEAVFLSRGSKPLATFVRPPGKARAARPGCVAQSRTRRQALRNAKEAIEAYIEALLEDGLPVPTQTDSEVVEVAVAAR